MKRLKKRNILSIKSLIMMFFVFSGAFYLYVINATAIQGYKIREKENKITNLQKENETLEIKKAELTSLYRIEEEVKNKGMEKIEEIVYLNDKKAIAYRK